MYQLVCTAVRSAPQVKCLRNIWAYIVPSYYRVARVTPWHASKPGLCKHDSSWFPVRDHNASGLEGPSCNEVSYLIWPSLRYLRSLKLNGASHNHSQKSLSGRRYGASENHRVLAGHTNHAVIHCTLRGNDDGYIGHTLESCRGLCISAPQCKA